MLSIDLLIPTRNRHDCLRRSLPSLLIAAKKVGAGILICDQSSTPFQALSVTTLHRPDIHGLPGARNVLLAASHADIVVFLDDDTDIAPDFLEYLACLAADEPHILAWGPVVEIRSVFIRRLHRLVHLGTFRDPRRHTCGPSNQRTTMLFGCCFAVRRKAALAIGFDARRTGYALGEDADFFQRLYRAHGQRPRARFSANLQATHRRDGHDRASAFQRGVAKGTFLRWWAREHGRDNPCTVVHVMIALVAAASGFGAEPGHWRGVLNGLGQVRC